MSRPNSSVPKGWAAVGACRRSRALWASGSRAVSSGAAAALTTRHPSNSAPDIRSNGVRRRRARAELTIGRTAVLPADTRDVGDRAASLALGGGYLDRL